MILQNITFLDQIQAPPSKSEAIRALVLSAVSTHETEIFLSSSCDDINICAEAIRVLGAKAERTEKSILVTPHAYDIAKDGFIPEFGNCATALRLIAPVYRAITGRPLPYTASPRLCSRIAALGSLYGAENADGSISVNSTFSSQTASGELIALAVNGGTLHLSAETVSRPYFDLTLQMLRFFRAEILQCDDRTFRVLPSSLCAPYFHLIIHCDYSAVAYPLIAGLIGAHSVNVLDCSFLFRQGDMVIVPFLNDIGAVFSHSGGNIEAFPSRLRPFVFDAKNHPDLVPPLCAAACSCAEISAFTNVDRLRHKESDRVAEIISAVRALGGYAEYANGTLSVRGPLRGGTLPHTEDHRIAMMGVLFSLLCTSPVETDSLGCVGKSYPDFIKTFRRTT